MPERVALTHSEAEPHAMVIRNGQGDAPIYSSGWRSKVPCAFGVSAPDALPFYGPFFALYRLAAT
jgi:hypothetical protein